MKYASGILEVYFKYTLEVLKYVSSILEIYILQIYFGSILPIYIRSIPKVYFIFVSSIKIKENVANINSGL